MSLTNQEYAEIITILDEYRQQHPERYMFVSQWMCELNTMRLNSEIKKNTYSEPSPAWKGDRKEMGE